MFKGLYFLKARPGMSRQEFIEYYETRHYKFVRYVPGVRKYMRRYLVPMPGAEESSRNFDYDVLMEMWFDDEAAMHSAMAFLNQGDHISALIEDEEKLFDRTRAVALRVEEHETDLTEIAFDR